MAVVGQDYYGLADVLKDTDPKGQVLDIAKILDKSTPFMEDMAFVEGNLPTGYKAAIQTALPASSFPAYYEGITPVKGKVQTVTFPTTRQRQLATVDADLVKIQNNAASFLMRKSMHHLMGMGQDWENEVIYGTGANPERIIGLATTYNTISTVETEVGFNVIDAGGTGSDNTSIWYIYWGDGNIHGIYPQGSTAGISKKQWEPRMVAAPDGVGEIEAIQILYKFDGGLAIPNWQSVVRIANIDVSELADAGESTFDGADIINYLIRAKNKFKSTVTSMGRPVIYCNRDVKTALDLLANNRDTLALNTTKAVTGEVITEFQGVPIRLAEKILSTEAQVT